MGKSRHQSHKSSHLVDTSNNYNSKKSKSKKSFKNAGYEWDDEFWEDGDFDSGKGKQSAKQYLKSLGNTISYLEEEEDYDG